MSGRRGVEVFMLPYHFPKLSLFLLFSLLPCAAQAQCDMHNYHPVDHMVAAADNTGVTLNWRGEAGADLRAHFVIKDGKPTVAELAIREQAADWLVLAENAVPDFQVTTGKRRISTAQLKILQQSHKDSPDNIEARKWDAFWDAPLSIPGRGNESAGLPRDPTEVRHDSVAYNTGRCQAISNGNRLAVRFDGLKLGLFSGDVMFTVYKGSNLLRQEAIAKTDAPSVAYIYKAGLSGLAVGPASQMAWLDTARNWQSYRFGGPVNTDPVALRARYRLLMLDTGKGSLAVFPTPHQFFFARENEVNLGYVYYRKDSASRFSLGVMQPEHGEGYDPWGVSDPVWNRRAGVARYQMENFALYNAPPKTEQHMSVYYLLSGKPPKATSAKVLAYTHGDVFKPLPGFKVMTGHFHMDLNEMLTDRGSMDYQPSWLPVFKGVGINIVYLGDFHDDSHARDPGPIRFKEQKVYFEGAEHLSDKDFLVMPAEEPNSFLGGHWYLLLPRPVYFSHPDKLEAGQQFLESDPVYGPVYHLSSSADVLEMVNREKGVMWTAHPRTKNSENYPEAYQDKDFFFSDRFIGASWEALPTDLSQKRLCEIRCFGTGDDMSNWAPKPKFMIAEGDTYMKAPDDETYPQLAVNYLKLDHVPAFRDSWEPVTETLRAGNFFGTTGEILFHNWGISGAGAHSTYNAEIEYTYPLDFAELVWSDGHEVQRKLIDLSDSMAFGTHKFAIPFDARGKKWVRFTVWDTAGNGAYLQPVALAPARL
jgi:hypothetical protein